MDKKKIIKNNRIRGKNAEKRSAKFLNFDRVGIFGKEDLKNDKFIVEVKTRKKLSFKKYFQQLSKNNKNNKIEIIIIGEKHAKIENFFAIIKLKDFKKIIYDCE